MACQFGFNPELPPWDCALAEVSAFWGLVKCLLQSWQPWSVSHSKERVISGFGVLTRNWADFPSHLAAFPQKAQFPSLFSFSLIERWVPEAGFVQESDVFLTVLGGGWAACLHWGTVVTTVTMVMLPSFSCSMIGRSAVTRHSGQ